MHIRTFKEFMENACYEKLCIHFKTFCININLSFNVTFHELPKIPLYFFLLLATF